MELSNMKSVELKEMAKNLKVKNWWNLNKATLIEEITKMQESQKEQPEVEEIPKEENKVEENRVESQLGETEENDDRKSTRGMDKEGITTLQDIINEVQKETGKSIRGMKARRVLRKSDIERPFKKWEWDNKEHANLIKKVKEILMGA